MAPRQPGDTTDLKTMDCEICTAALKRATFEFFVSWNDEDPTVSELQNRAIVPETEHDSIVISPEDRAMYLRHSRESCQYQALREWFARIPSDLLVNNAPVAGGAYDELREFFRRSQPGLTGWIRSCQAIGSSRTREAIQSGGLRPMYITELEFWIVEIGIESARLHHSLSFYVDQFSGNSMVPWLHEGPKGYADVWNNGAASWEFISEQFENCRTQHKACSKARSLTAWSAPPRLLRLVQGGLRLIDTIQPGRGNPEYVALSYCWGDCESLCLVESTSENFHNVVPEEMLPDVLRDAMIVCAQLKREYLWVDRLCIRQDDLADWTRHAQMMENIYGNAAFVLSAASSSAANQSFLGEVSEAPRAATRATTIEIGNDRGLRVRLRPRIDLAHSLVQPIDTRGWTFQEGYLAVASLRFESAKTVWACAQGEEYETVNGRGDARRVRGVREVFALETLGSGRPRPWHSALEQYTGRKLKKDTDRLPAISGLASRFSKLLQSRYLAGLWEQHLLVDLMWYVAVDPKTEESYVVPGAPSWSWASLRLMISTMRPIEGPEWHELAEVVDSLCTPSTVNPFGPVESDCYVSITGPLSHGTLADGLLFWFYHFPKTSTIRNRQPAPSVKDMTEHRLSFPNIAAVDYLEVSLDGPLVMTGIAAADGQHSEGSCAAAGHPTWQRAVSAGSQQTQTEDRASVRLLVIGCITFTSGRELLYTMLLTPHPEHPDVFLRIGRVVIRFDGRDARESFLANWDHGTVKIM